MLGIQIDWFVAVFMGAVILLGMIMFLKVLEFIGRNAATIALREWVFTGVLAGERSVIWGFQQLEAEIEATDKKKVAESIYNLLPDVLSVFGIPIPINAIKWLVPVDKFAKLLKVLYDKADAFLKSNETYLKDQAGALKWQIAPSFTADGDANAAINGAAT